MRTRTTTRVLVSVAQSLAALGGPGLRLARRLLDHAVLLSPRSPEVRGWRCMLEASAARSEGDIERSVALLREAGAHMPANDLVIASLGVDLSAAGRHEEAIQTIERALRGETDITGEAQVWTSLAWSYLRSGRAPKVSHVFDRAQESRAVSPELRVIRVLALAVVHGFVQRDRLVELVRLRAGVVPMVLDFAHQLAGQSKYDLARQLLRCLPETVARRGYELMARKSISVADYTTAVWALKQYEIAQPSSYLAPMLRAEVSLRRGDASGAVKHLRVALERAPTSRAVLEQAVRVRAVRGDWPEADGLARKALEKRSTSALVGGVAALALLADGQREQARRLFTVQRVGDDLDCVFGYAAQALIAARFGGWDRSLELVEQALRQMQRSPAWALTDPVKARLSVALRESLDASETAVDDLSAETLAELRERVAQLSSAADQALPPTRNGAD